MSYVRTLATVAMGLAAAKGTEKFRGMGGFGGMQKMMQDAGGSMGLQLGAMAEKFGVPGGAQQMNEFMAKFTGAPASGTEAGSAGLGGLLAAMRSTAETGGKMADDMMKAMFSGTPVAMAQEENAKLMLRAMIQAAKADGDITETEKQTIMQQLGDVDEEEKAFVESEMAKPMDPMALAKDTQDSMKAQVYATSLMAIRVDSAGESQYLRQLAQALGLSDEARNRVHASMGVPPLKEA